jgi:DNA-binding transcriptional ArsR family regulator
MPVEFDEYTPEDGSIRFTEGSNAYEILSFLARNHGTGYTPKEIHEATGVPRGSVGATLRRLAERGLVRHKEPYWSAAEAERLQAFETAARGQRAAAERLGTEDEALWLEHAEDPRESRRDE